MSAYADWQKNALIAGYKAPTTQQINTVLQKAQDAANSATTATQKAEAATASATNAVQQAQTATDAAQTATTKAGQTTADAAAADASAVAALASEQAAGTHAADALADKQAADASATAASDSAAAASGSAAAAADSEASAAAHEAGALASKNAAATSAASAQDWATKIDGPVGGGADYSAKYWAQQASSIVNLNHDSIVTALGFTPADVTATLAKNGDTATGKMHFTATDSKTTPLGNVSGAVSIDCSAAQAYSFTPTAAVTLSFTNPPAANTSQVILLKVTNGGAFTLSFPAGTKYPGGALGTLTSSGVDWLGVAYDADLSAWVVFVLGKAVA